MLGGVCGGLGEYLSLDPTVVRLLWVLFTFVGASGLLAYLICLLIIPENQVGQQAAGVPDLSADYPGKSCVLNIELEK